MTKDQIDEIAIRVAKDRYVAQHSGTGEGINFANYAEFTHALLAELAKVQEPAGFIAHNPGGYYEGSHIPAAPYNFAEFYGEMPTAGTKFYLNPLPQPDLAAEIERLSRINSELCRVHNQHVIWGARFEEQMAALRQQLSAAQSRIELLEHDAKTGDYETLYAQTVVELSAAQASEDELLEALETLACLGNGDMYGNSQGNAIAQQAIATHKARKEGK